jgi:hypothetical protein
MEVGSPEIPKLFKLTAAVTSIVPILRATRQILAKYSEKKAGNPIPENSKLPV